MNPAYLKHEKPSFVRQAQSDQIQSGNQDRRPVPRGPGPEWDGMNQVNHLAGFGTLFSTRAALTSPAQEFAIFRPTSPALRGLRGRRDPWPRLGWALAALRQRRERARQRRALQQLDDRLLRDIGLTRAEVGEQLQAPFLPGRGLWHL
jgi:uncharacterized protein YjiS (DUF1127 family)